MKNNIPVLLINKEIVGHNLCGMLDKAGNLLG